MEVYEGLTGIPILSVKRSIADIKSYKGVTLSAIDTGSPVNEVTILPGAHLWTMKLSNRYENPMDILFLLQQICAYMDKYSEDDNDPYNIGVNTYYGLFTFQGLRRISGLSKARTKTAASALVDDLGILNSVDARIKGSYAGTVYYIKPDLTSFSDETKEKLASVSEVIHRDNTVDQKTDVHFLYHGGPAVEKTREEPDAYPQKSGGLSTSIETIERKLGLGEHTVDQVPAVGEESPINIDSKTNNTNKKEKITYSGVGGKNENVEKEKGGGENLTFEEALVRISKKLERGIDPGDEMEIAELVRIGVSAEDIDYAGNELKKRLEKEHTKGVVEHPSSYLIVTLGRHIKRKGKSKNGKAARSTAEMLTKGRLWESIVESLDNLDIDTVKELIIKNCSSEEEAEETFETVWQKYKRENIFGPRSEAQ